MGRIALIGENSIEYVNNLLDIWNNGDCAVLIDWRIPPDSAISMMLEAGVRLCYVQDKFYSTFNQLNIDIQFLPYHNNTVTSMLMPLEVYDKFVSNYSYDEAVVIYSSGTTGKSKGIILSHYAINTNADAIIDYMKPTTDDCVYMVKTISHASCITGEILVALKTFTPLLIGPIIVPPRYTLANVKKYKVTIMCINPTLLQMYIDEYDHNRSLYDLSSIKEIYVHGAKANLKLVQEAQNIFKTTSIYYEYGLTEAGPRVTTQKISSNCINSVGKAIKGVEVKIINEYGFESQNYEYGAVHVKTPSQYIGYIYGSTKFTSRFDNWLNTGDVGYFDENNELHIVGRVDDVIIINAHKIYSSEIEAYIMLHTSIKECAVVKIEDNNDVFLGCLYVGDLDALKIKCLLRTRFMQFEIPQVLIKCEAIPKTINGKVDKKIIKQYIMNKYLGDEK